MDEGETVSNITLQPHRVKTEDMEIIPVEVKSTNMTEPVTRTTLALSFERIADKLEHHARYGISDELARRIINAFREESLRLTSEEL